MIGSFVKICLLILVVQSKLTLVADETSQLIVQGFFESFQLDISVSQVVSNIDQTEFLVLISKAMRFIEKNDEESKKEGIQLLAIGFQDISNSLEQFGDQTHELLIVEKILNNLLEQIRNPVKFHYLESEQLNVNGVDILKELNQAQENWQIQSFLQFGKNVGEILSKQFEEIENVSAIINDAAVIEVIFDGVLDGIIDASGIKGKDIRQCVQGSNIMIIDFEESIRLLQTGLPDNVITSLQVFGDGLQHFPQALDACKSSIKEAAKLAKQLRDLIKALSSPQSFIFHIGIDLIVNGKDIYREIFTAVDDWKQGNWYDFGFQLGKAMYQIFVGLEAQQIQQMKH